MTPREHRQQARKLRQKLLERRQQRMARVVVAKSGVVQVSQTTPKKQSTPPPLTQPQLVIEPMQVSQPVVLQPKAQPKQGCGKCRRQK